MINCGYVVLTIVFAPIDFGQIQFRIAGSMTILPFLLGCNSRTLCGMSDPEIF